MRRGGDRAAHGRLQVARSRWRRQWPLLTLVYEERAAAGVKRGLQRVRHTARVTTGAPASAPAQTSQRSTPLKNIHTVKNDAVLSQPPPVGCRESTHDSEAISRYERSTQANLTKAQAFSDGATVEIYRPTANGLHGAQPHEEGTRIRPRKPHKPTREQLCFIAPRASSHPAAANAPRPCATC